MAGQPQPTRLLKAFAADAISDDITLPIPEPSQIAINPGAASLTDGFPPACFADPAAGGVLPSGADFNGVLNMATAAPAYLMAGQRPFYDATLQTFMGGYALGAVLAQAADPTATWTSAVDANMTDPDSGGAGWISSTTVYSAAALTGLNDVVLPTISDCVIDVDCSGGAKAFTGFAPGRPNQRVTLRKSDASANGLSVLSENVGSAAANRVQCVAPSLGAPLRYMDFTIQYIPALSRWIQR
jgi:hypothetical protein